MPAKKKPDGKKEIAAAKAAMIDVSDLTPKVVSVDGQMLNAMPKEFSTGSKGYHASGKLLLDGSMCQANIILTIIGSKPKKDGE
jgi:hypothetical protein